MIKVFDNHEALSEAAALLFAEEARRAVQGHGRFSVCLSGGETPRRAYQLLAQKPLRSHVPWQGVHIFFADERVVAPHDLRSNQGMVRRELTDHVPLAADQVHAIPVEGSPERCAAGYEGVLRGFFGPRRARFDLVLLGLGADGHTASLFPGSAALEELDRWVAAVPQDAPQLSRITVTAPLINEAATVAFVVSGESKGAALREVLKGEGGRRLPASLIRPSHGQLLWLVDREAAQSL